MFCSPAPEQIKAARKAAGHTQKQAAETVRATSYRTWQDWETGRREMHPGLWELYIIKTGQQLQSVES